MLIGGLIRSMYQAFQFKDYKEGAWDMYDLNEFLKGFGGYGEQTVGDQKMLLAKMAMDDMPAPDADPADARERKNPDLYFENYRRMYAGRLMKMIGIYQRTMIDEIKNKGYY